MYTYSCPPSPHLICSQEYNACDGAQEPGRSYGGACANSLLKVLYDAANGNTDAMTQMDQDAEALFADDEEDEEEHTDTPFVRSPSVKTGYSMDNSVTINTFTWNEMVRKMKAEMKDIQYAQTPKITTSRKIDLNQPFSIVPPKFDPKKGKKRSLLIGCNYHSIPGAELKASHDDIRSIKVCLYLAFPLLWTKFNSASHRCFALMTGLHCKRSRLSRNKGLDDYSS
jgi:hypothetical protein